MTDLESVKSEPAHLVEPRDDKDFWRVVCEPCGRVDVPLAMSTRRQTVANRRDRHNVAHEDKDKDKEKQ